ncbi:phage portal protein [Parageobacillus thermoglucosidasius]|uniref:phage portal protein n=1 Tax=Parageobacillus thermoglucosidasius TaxID=1426 RepID=UPI000E1935FC|nr:phage portal protein [Parageobacillus thermoglucosidasius]MED4904114.1 phage portal protein [Parageobacillus thermoglucosidasius]MED4915664.1 phage portal protein [Parageobacillus thermoglucosidasius]MED4945071.1 phage portal protein [Parageobacillus thermoglucosidasius]MED4983732.1 phage portal protein [Parageobacillus thermoglucosidasius]RDE19326.1 phage portal protein [Parageobacillus thermoglucosidasius]
MWKNLIAKLRQVMYRMGLIRGIKSVYDKKEIPVNETFYNQIDVWKALYSGYHEDFHKVKYHTINGGTKTRRMATLNMPKVVSQELATLIFNEKCEINISDQEFEKNVKEVFRCNSFYRQFQHYLEYSFALGGAVIKAYADESSIRLGYVTADCFIPLSWDNSGIHEGVFVSEIRRQNKKYTHLEWHVWEGAEYVIRNELYESSGEDLGVRVPLDTLFPNLEEEVRIQNLKRPLFVYIKPNTANNIDPTIPLGISIYANALDTLKSLDIAFDSFQREFRLGRKRIIVPAAAIKTVVDPKTGQVHRYFDANDEVYEAFNFDQDSNEIKDITVELRVEEHIDAINALLDLLAMQIGFSAGSFTFDGQSVKTATEVVSENSKTFRTKQSHETIIEAAIQELVEIIGQVAELYEFFSVPDEYKVTVTFDDSIVQDKSSDAQYWINLVNNRMAPRKLAIQKVLGVTEEEAAAMLEEIQKEQQTVTAQAIDLFGMGSGGE